MRILHRANLIARVRAEIPQMNATPVLPVQFEIYDF